MYDEFGRVFRQPHTYKGTKIRRSIRIDGYSTVYPDVARQFRDANISAGSTIVAHGSPETGSGLYLSYMFANGPSAEAICAAERGCVMLLDLTCLGFVKLWRNPPPMIIHDDDDVFDYDVAFLVEVVETMISRPS